MPDPRGKTIWGYAVAFGLALLALPLIGAEHLEWNKIWAFLRGEDTVQGLILCRQRIPRVLLALLVGGALSITGASLQVLFRNPLAEPWTLGVAGGAAIGAFLAQLFPVLQVRAIGWLTATQMLSLLGAVGVMGLVWVFVRRLGAGRVHALLLVGVTISTVSGGIMMLLAYFVSPFELVVFHRWLMGGLDVIGYRDVGALLILGLPGVLLLVSMAREYNHLAFNEEMALGHGVDVVRVQWKTFVGAGLTTAACVAVAGPIGFVGMIVPHIVRRLTGIDHRRVLPGAFLLGGVVLALCDSIARTVIAPTEIPVGVITAVFGGPVFLWLLFRSL